MRGVVFCLGLLVAGIAHAGGGPAPRPGMQRLELGLEELVLDNGMRIALVPRPGAPLVAAGWVVAAGSADEPADAPGLSHLLEHLLFQGTRTVGTADGAAEAELRARLERDRVALAELAGRSGRRARVRRLELEHRLDQTAAEIARLARPGELSLLYSEAGGFGLNAHTLEDLTFFYVALPPEQLELWFWLESDRLAEPVFRDLDRERRVVAEERRLRIDASPTGRLDEAVRAAFWGEVPYAHRPVGPPGAGEAAEGADLRAFFERHYRPANLTAVLVGGFEPAAARRLARRYFGRLAAPPPGARAGEPSPWRAQLAAERWDGRCDCPPQVQILYPTVPFAHPDGYALQVAAGLLSGRSGRLHRRLVVDAAAATVAEAGQRPLRRAGSFVFRAVSREGVEPDALVAAWDGVVSELAAAPIGEAEMRRVRAQMAAASLSRLKDPLGLLTELLIYAGMGRAREIEEWPARVLAVDEAAVRAAVRAYLVDRPRLVATYRRDAAHAAAPAAAGGP